MVNIKEFAKRHSVILQNLSFLSILQIFLLIAPLITYPYLTQTLGRELYGYIISAQVLASYFSIIIDFGSNSVCAKHVSQNRDNKEKLSEIVCSVFYTRLLLWIIGIFVLLAVVMLIPTYREQWLLFLLTYGVTTNELLFPQYFFQGIEKMKYSTIINITIKSVFIALIFVVVKEQSDYIFVPILNTIGYLSGGFVAMFTIFKTMGINWSRPNIKAMKSYIKDSSTIFATDLICTIKDKLNYLFVGLFAGMDNVVIYDLGSKLYNLLIQPNNIIKTVLFPRMAQTRNINAFKKSLLLTLGISIVLVGIANIFLPQIVEFFLHEQIVLWPIRLFLLAPIMISVSVMIASNLCVAFGYNKYVLYSIIITTITYLVAFAIMYFCDMLQYTYSFILLAIISFLTELIYRLFVYKKIVKLECNK